MIQKAGTNDRISPLSAGALRLAVIQMAPVYLDAWATWDKVRLLADQAMSQGAEVITWGETLIPGYPIWMSVTTTEAQGPVYAKYWDQAVTLDGALVKEMRHYAKTKKVMLIGGVAERASGSTYCTTLTIGADGELLGRHRKLKPTWLERTVWADGDGLGLRTYPTKIGRIGSLNCWENWLPLARAALHQQEEFVHVGVWPGSFNLVDDITRFIALEGGSWSVAACGLLRRSDMEHLDPDEIPIRDALLNRRTVWQNGGSMIISPTGEIVAGPLLDDEGVIFADLTVREVVETRQYRDPSGHYSRPDVLRLEILGDNANRAS